MPEILLFTSISKAAVAQKSVKIRLMSFTLDPDSLISGQSWGASCCEELERLSTFIDGSIWSDKENLLEGHDISNCLHATSLQAIARLRGVWPWGMYAVSRDTDTAESAATRTDSREFHLQTGKHPPLSHRLSYAIE